jgi:hypothetical protein
MDYEARLFDSASLLKLVIPMSCETDTAALTQLIKMGIADFESVAIWRGCDCIYNGRNVTRHRPRGT